MTKVLSNLVQLSLVALAIGLVTVGEWPVAVAAVIGALVLRWADISTEHAYRRFVGLMLFAAWFFFGKSLGW